MNIQLAVDIIHANEYGFFDKVIEEMEENVIHNKTELLFVNEKQKNRVLSMMDEFDCTAIVEKIKKGQYDANRVLNKNERRGKCFFDFEAV